MKPIHILALVLAGAIGGAVLMNVRHRPQPIAVTEIAASPAKPPATVPVSSPARGVEQPAAPPSAEPLHPSTAQEPAAVAKRSRPAPKIPARVATARRKPSPVPPPPANPRPLGIAAPQPAATADRVAVNQPPAEPPKIEAAPPVAQERPSPFNVPAPSQPENVTPPAPPPPAPHVATLNAGMLIPVRLVDGLSSERNSPGDMFIATLDRELVADGFVIAERGARVEGRVVQSAAGTKLKGGATLSVELTRLHTSDHQTVPIFTDPFEKRMLDDRGQDVAKVGAGAAIGAIIGALAGGGKGAAVGAGVGGGAGAGDIMLTRKPAALPSETRITFRLRSPVTLTEKQ